MPTSGFRTLVARLRGAGKKLRKKSEAEAVKEVAEGITFQQFLRKNSHEIGNKLSFEVKITITSENYSTKPSQNSDLLCGDIVQSKFFCRAVVSNASLSRDIVQSELTVVRTRRYYVGSVI